MKKILSLFSGLALVLALSPAAYAKVDRVQGDWELTAPTSIDFVCGGGTYEHMLNAVSMMEDGSFTGTGYYVSNPGYTWDMTGEVDGDILNFTIVYDGLNSGNTYNGEGQVNPDGSITGYVDNNCQTFSMEEGSATAFMGNHGQYVKMSENKKEAAQSRIGMPVQSKGHMSEPKLVETLMIMANDVDGVDSIVLKNGKKYLFKVSGTAYAGAGIDFDADYSTINGTDWFDLVPGYEGYGDELLQLQVDGMSTEWGDFNLDHQYEMDYMGMGSSVNFTIYDIHYPSNTGYLTVEIYEL